MMGAGIFINSVELSKRAGILGGFIYIIVGILLLPLIISIAQMVNLYPDGGFFTYAKQELSPLAAFVSTWAYFVGKLGSAILLIHTAFSLLMQIIPALSSVSIYVLDILVVAVFICLNMFNLKTGKIIQAWLMAFKLIPIFFVIFCGLFLLQPAVVTTFPVVLEGIPTSIPLVLFAFLGFEATCSLSSNIVHAKRNGPLAIFISYAIVILFYFLYQFLLYAAVGPQLVTQQSYLATFPLLLKSLFAQLNVYGAQLFLNIAVAASALGGSYGILYSNSWNLYMLARHKFVPFSGYLASLNQNQIPYVCVIIEGIICILYLLITGGNQIPLQLTSVMGSITAYTLSIIALWALAGKNAKLIEIPRWIIYCALINCAVLIGFCLRNVVLLGSWHMAGFFALLIGGTLIFQVTNSGRR